MARSVITVLRKDGVIIAPFTNNLAAYMHLKQQLPEHERTLLPSYSTVHRVVKDPGNSKAFNTSLGTFIIQKLNLYKKAF